MSMALTDYVAPVAGVDPIKLALARGGRPPIGSFGATTPTFTGNAGYQIPQVSLTQFLNRGAIPGAPTQTAPTQLFASTKSAPLQQQINSATQTRAANQQQAQQSLTDFTREFLDSKGKVQKASDQESASLNNIYGTGQGSLEQQLAAFNRQKQAATSAAAQSAIGRAMRANRLARAQSGNSSYLDRALAQQLAEINTGAAGQAADQGRADLQYLTGLRTGNIGRQQSIIDNVLNRNFMPAEAAANMENLNLHNLGSLANLEYGNNTYNTPENEVMNRLNFYQDLIRRGWLPS
jgi:hypothetical protein